ncbi:hypothetical protein M947_05850 [Sulfurimonas hongkongensis]|uniref:Uncharacterized protein n=1 Tax=Sulfurimonas hongkongensis TaxID=1172190 RepID=T0KR31_9BACT|nr:DUF1007 family protein [Sulfurimonas hongkongensis]EQB39514.1 hypothetical protein M947_05850 [Sulfurimonas hongkongensis]
MKTLMIFLLANIVLYAHPHIFIDIYPKLNIQDTKVTSLSLEWKFDQMTSSVLIMDYDKNKDNKFSKNEIALMKRNTIKLFKDHNYYLKIRENDRYVEIEKLDNFVATIDKAGRLVYSFDLICSFEVKDSMLMFYDKGYYISFMLKKTFVAPLNKNINFNIRKVDNGTYFGYAMLIKDII